MTTTDDAVGGSLLAFNYSSCHYRAALTLARDFCNGEFQVISERMNDARAWSQANYHKPFKTPEVLATMKPKKRRQCVDIYERATWLGVIRMGVLLYDRHYEEALDFALEALAWIEENPWPRGIETWSAHA